MVAYLVAAAVLLVAFVPLGRTAMKGSVMDAVVAYEAASSIAVMEFILLAEGFGRPGEFEFPVVLSVLLFSSGLVYLHAMERWL